MGAHSDEEGKKWVQLLWHHMKPGKGEGWSFPLGLGCGIFVVAAETFPSCFGDFLLQATDW